MKTLILILVLILSISCYSQNKSVGRAEVEAELYLTQKNVAIKTNAIQANLYSDVPVYDYLSYDSVYSSPEMKSKGEYMIKLLFTSKDSVTSAYLDKLFYKDAECKLLLKLWGVSLTNDCYINEIYVNRPGLYFITIFNKTPFKVTTKKSNKK